MVVVRTLRGKLKLKLLALNSLFFCGLCTLSFCNIKILLYFSTLLPSHFLFYDYLWGWSTFLILLERHSWPTFCKTTERKRSWTRLYARSSTSLCCLLRIPNDMRTFQSILNRIIASTIHSFLDGPYSRWKGPFSRCTYGCFCNQCYRFQVSDHQLIRWVYLRQGVEVEEFLWPCNSRFNQARPKVTIIWNSNVKNVFFTLNFLFSWIRKKRHHPVVSHTIEW